MNMESPNTESKQPGRQVRSVVAIRPPLPGEEHRELLNLRPHPSGDYIIDIGDTGVSLNPPKDPRFVFPAVYGFQADDLSVLCEREVEPLLRGCFEGESAALIAYGETGSGKSFLCGTEARTSNPWPGSVGVYIARRIWESSHAANAKSDLYVECSMIEIYREKSSKEQVFDLLAGYQRKKVEREYSTGSSHVVKSSQELLARLSEGAALRNTDKTDGNARSSRSHAIFTVRLSYTRQDSDSRQQRVNGRFLLVDLAGAESASTADVGSFQQRQGSGINTGLSALQTVIMEASETPEAHGGVVKYRLSKLTYILRPALGGEGGRQGCNVIFVGCINPLAGKGSRTRTTLQYISQAAKIKNVVQADVESLESRRDRVLAQQIDVLKSQNRELAAELQATKTAYQTTGTFDGTQSGIAGPTQSRFVDGPSASRIVVLSVEEHTALLRQVQESNDMVAALEVVLKRNVEEHERLERELGSAVKRAEEAQKAAVDGRSSAGAGSTPQATDAAPSPLLPFEVAGCKSTAVSPGLSALAVSPILAAARAMLDTAGSLSFSPEDLARHEPLAVEDICLNEEESNLEPDQFVVLRRLIENRLEDAAQKCADVDDNRQAPSSTSQPCGDDAGQTILTGVGGKEDAELVAALHRRTAEVAALRLAVSAYNECLGTVASELDIVRARELEVTTHLQQAAREKVQYVELAAKFDQALDVSQFDVLDLQTQVQQMQRRQSLTSNNNNNNNGNGGGILGRMVLGRYGSGTSGSTTPRGSITSSSPGQLSPQRQSSNAPSRSGSSRRSSAFQAIGSLFRASVSPAAETSGLVLHEEEKKEEEEEGLMGADSDSDCDEKCGHTVPHTVPPSRLEPVGSEVIVLGPTPPAQMKLHVGRLDAFPIENLTGLSDDEDASQEVIDLVDNDGALQPRGHRRVLLDNPVVPLTAREARDRQIRRM